MPETKSRKTFLITAGSLAAVLAVIIFWQVSLNVGIRPTDSEQTILLFVLSTLVSLTFLVFGFILTRSIVKLYIERRANQLGSKFKTKLVIGALALSLLPVIFQFYFSYVLTNRTLTRWFTQPFQSVTQQTRAIVAETSRFALEETEADTLAIAQGPLGEALRSGKREEISALLEPAARRHGLDFLVVETPEGVLARFPRDAPELSRERPRDERGALEAPVTGGAGLPSRIVRQAGAEYAVAILPLDSQPGARLIAAKRLPVELSARLGAMEREQETYNRLHGENRVLRNIYNAILALVTVIILFIATWVALFLSKQVTVPIQALAEATHQVSLGNLSHRIHTRAVDELGVLVRSFNEMTAQIEESRAELERRRRETEAILESIPTAVISLSRDQRVVRTNPAVERMFGPERARAATLRELLAPEDQREMAHLLRRALRQGLATSQFELSTATGRLNVAVTLSALRGARDAGYDPTNDIAYILVMEDISDLLHAQQAQTWREVAQRVAHEIKNPLTPIRLSAERIRRHLERLAGPGADADARRVIGDCSALIEQEVSTLKTLVDEFSQLARFPEARLAPTDLNRVVENALGVFDGRLDGIRIRLELASDLPPVNLDADQFKRVIVNLVDNAAEAMDGSLHKELHISTALDPRGEFVEVVVADTGHGISSELKEKLFLPYFSTKKRGTGLGLAIVSRILAEHRGSIRVEENHPVGARFIVELPVEASGSDNSRP